MCIYTRCGISEFSICEPSSDLQEELLIFVT